MQPLYSKSHFSYTHLPSPFVIFTKKLAKSFSKGIDSYRLTVNLLYSLILFTRKTHELCGVVTPVPYILKLQRCYVTMKTL